MKAAVRPHEAPHTTNTANTATNGNADAAVPYPLLPNGQPNWGEVYGTSLIPEQHATLTGTTPLNEDRRSEPAALPVPEAIALSGLRLRHIVSTQGRQERREERARVRRNRQDRETVWFPIPRDDGELPERFALSRSGPETTVHTPVPTSQRDRHTEAMDAMIGAFGLVDSGGRSFDEAASGHVGPDVLPAAWGRQLRKRRAEPKDLPKLLLKLDKHITKNSDRNAEPADVSSEFAGQVHAAANDYRALPARQKEAEKAQRRQLIESERARRAQRKQANRSPRLQAAMNSVRDLLTPDDGDAPVTAPVHRPQPMPQRPTAAQRRVTTKQPARRVVPITSRVPETLPRAAAPQPARSKASRVARAALDAVIPDDGPESTDALVRTRSARRQIQPDHMRQMAPPTARASSVRAKMLRTAKEAARSFIPDD